MTKEEKYKAIMERAPAIPKNYEPIHLSFMVITGYLDELVKEGLVVSAHSVTSKGKDAVCICEEFDWKPTDEEIDLYISEFVPIDSQAELSFFIKKYRDDKVKLIEKFKKFKKDNGL